MTALGEVVATVGTPQITRAIGDGAAEPLLAGVRLFPGDVITTSEQSAAEFTFGVNSRFRLAPKSKVELTALTKQTQLLGAVETSTNTYTLNLKTGTLRLRVKENTVTRELVTLRTERLEFFVRRADLAVAVSGSDKNSGGYPRALLTWGTLQYRTTSTTSGAASEPYTQTEPGELLLGGAAKNTPPPWNPLSAAEAQAKITALVPFSVDVPRVMPKIDPGHESEMRGG
jgi:hypothetical protein